MAKTVPTSIEAKAFVPARDFELSKRFYEAIGFTLEWEAQDLACFRNGASRFMLQNFHVPDHSHNFVMSLLVDDVDAWWEFVSSAVGDFGMTVQPPEDRPWGMRDFPLEDPSGVLWRVAQTIAI